MFGPVTPSLQGVTESASPREGQGESGRGLPHSKTLRESGRVDRISDSFWSAAVLCRFFTGRHFQPGRSLPLYKLDSASSTSIIKSKYRVEIPRCTLIRSYPLASAS